MKRYWLALSVVAFALMLPVLRVLAAVAPEDVDTNAELFDLLGQAAVAMKSGNAALSIAVVLTILIAVLRNSGKIPILKVLKIDVLVAKIPKTWFASVVLGLGAILGIATGLAGGASLLTALQSGLQSALMATGVHQVAKGPLSALGFLPKSSSKK